MVNFSKIPFLRLLIPFVLGIIIYSGLNLYSDVFYLLFFVFFVLSLVYFVNKKTSDIIKNVLFIVISDIFLFLSGFYGCYHFNPKSDSNYFGYSVTHSYQNWVGEIDGIAVEKESFYKAVVNVKSINDSVAAGKLLVYLKKPLNENSVKPGYLIKASSQIQEIKGPQNPNEFNYKKFMEYKGVLYQTFVEPDAVVTEKTKTTISYSGLATKLKIIKVFYNCGLSNDAAGLCSALITGYDDEMSSEIINAFARSGTLHVLSVSGLHTGIVFAVVMFVLGWIDKANKYKLLKLVVVLVILWFFVFVAGFSPPVLRAAIMLSLISIGKYYYSYLSNITLNVLAVSAFLILLFNPMLIYDIGFLLSYTAVLGILLFEPKLTSLINSKHSFVNKVWQLMCVSVAAQISTLPLTLYYFHQFPIWFVFTNILVIPLCAVIMLLGFLLLLKLWLLSGVLNGLTRLVLFIVSLTDKAGVGYIDAIDFSFKDAVLLSVVILLFTAMINYRTYVYAVTLMITVIIWLLFSVLETYSVKSKNGLLVYQCNKQTAIDLKNKQVLFQYANVNQQAYDFHIKNNIASYNYADKFDVNYNFIDYNNNKVLIVKQGRDLSLIRYLQPDYLIITNNFVPDENDIINTKVRQVICDGSNSFKTLKLLKKLCNELKISVYSTKEKGFLELPL